MDDLISRHAAKLKGLHGEKGDTAEDFNNKCVDCLDDAQPEEAIPVSWISAQMERLKGMDNLFAELTADVTATALNEWRKELEGKTE